MAALSESAASAEGAAILRFEDLARKSPPAPLLDWLSSVEAGLADRCVPALESVLDRATPTFSGRRSNWRDFWDDRAEKFFEKSGLRELNAKLGYE